MMFLIRSLDKVSTFYNNDTLLAFDLDGMLNMFDRSFNLIWTCNPETQHLCFVKDNWFFPFTQYKVLKKLGKHDKKLVDQIEADIFPILMQNNYLICEFYFQKTLFLSKIDIDDLSVTNIIDLSNKRIFFVVDQRRFLARKQNQFFLYDLDVSEEPFILFDGFFEVSSNLKCGGKPRLVGQRLFWYVYDIKKREHKATVCLDLKFNLVEKIIPNFTGSIKQSDGLHYTSHEKSLQILDPNTFEVKEIDLGENIFAVGDFGTGEDNIAQMDPEIAPGYTYVTNPPPDDGFYIITNDMKTSNWDAVWNTWLRISDNSDDPNGYMMVVNASGEPGNFYEERIEGLCENQLYEFSVDVINLIRKSVNGHHEPNLSFLLDDEVQYSSGIIAQDEKWHRYGFTFTTGPNQTELKLTLRNNAPGGTGNDLALDNISFRPCGPNAFANAEEEFLICSNSLDPVAIEASIQGNSSIQWQFLNVTNDVWENIEDATSDSIFHDNFEPGAYQYRYLSAGSAVNLMNPKCRVISDIAEIRVFPVEFTIYDTICESVPYLFGSQSLMEAGLYKETFIASTGCDSVVELFLSIHPKVDFSFYENAMDPLCFGDDGGSIEILNFSGGIEPITFAIDSIANNVGFFDNLGSGDYQVKISDRFKCEEIVEFSLFDPEEFLFELGNDTTIELGSTYDLVYISSHHINRITWEGEKLNCSDCLDNSARPFEDTRYVAYAERENGCIDSSSILISVNDVTEQFYRPNIFSPNEDGINDVFRIYTNTLAVEEVELFVIADRWGNIVFEKRNLTFEDEELSWDGKLHQKRAIPGIYLYLVQLRLISGERVALKGDVTLVR